MSRFINQVAQVVRNTQAGTLPAGGYQYQDRPYQSAELLSAEAQFYARIMREYGSIEAYNQRKREI
jgi:hypothetical protein